MTVAWAPSMSQAQPRRSRSRGNPPHRRCEPAGTQVRQQSCGDGVSQGPPTAGEGKGLLISPQPRGPDLETGQRLGHRPGREVTWGRTETGQQDAQGFTPLPATEDKPPSRTAGLLLSCRSSRGPSTAATPRPRANEVAQARDPGAGRGGSEATGLKRCRGSVLIQISEGQRGRVTAQDHKARPATHSVSVTDRKPPPSPTGSQVKLCPKLGRESLEFCLLLIREQAVLILFLLVNLLCSPSSSLNLVLSGWRFGVT